MENPRGKTTNGGDFEENTMAILDSSGVKDAQDVLDDRLSFLEAVRAASLSSDSPSTPSWKMFDAIFQILRGSGSLELAMSSYQLLTDLNKRYPRVYLVRPDKQESGLKGVGELIMAKEAWSPFLVGAEIACAGEESSGSLVHLFDSSRFCTLVEDIAQAIDGKNSQMEIKLVENMLLFQYLVSVLEADFVHRHTLFKEAQNWSLCRESILNLLLASRRINLKSLSRACMSIVSKNCQHSTSISMKYLKNAANTGGKVAHNCDVALQFLATELERETCSAMQRLLTLIMELDLIRREADLQGLTSRADGVRRPILEIILDELMYNKDHVSPFLEVLLEPRWKLEIILQYFQKYCTKSVHTRRSSDSSDEATFERVLTYFSTPANTKNMVKKISSEVAQLLLAHAFQAFLSLQHDRKFVTVLNEKVGGSTPLQICNGFISAFNNIRKIDEDSEITSFEKGALFTAATIVSQKS